MHYKRIYLSIFCLIMLILLVLSTAIKAAPRSVIDFTDNQLYLSIENMELKEVLENIRQVLPPSIIFKVIGNIDDDIDYLEYKGPLKDALDKIITGKGYGLDIKYKDGKVCEVIISKSTGHQNQDIKDAVNIIQDQFPVLPEDYTPGAYKQGELIVKFRYPWVGQYLSGEHTGHSDSNYKNELSRLEAINNKYRLISLQKLSKSKNENFNSPYILCFPPDTDIESISREYGDLDLIKYADLNYKILKNSSSYSRFEPNDPGFENDFLWNLEKIELPEAWAIARQGGAEEIVVAVIDTGVYTTHEDLHSNIWVNSREIPDNQIEDMEGHGSHCAGIIAAITDNNEGISGFSPTNHIKIMPLRAEYVSDVNEALYFAADNKARVINMSIGVITGPDNPIIPSIEEALDYAIEHNCVLVAAAGNYNTEVRGGTYEDKDGNIYEDCVIYPAAYDPVITVASIDKNSQKAWTSNYGPCVDLSAPGTKIVSTWIDNKYVRASGTSMAAPHVAGLAALLLTKCPDLTADQVLHYLKEGAQTIDQQNPDHEGLLGAGLINAFETLSLVSPFQNDATDIRKTRDADLLKNVVIYDKIAPYQVYIIKDSTIYFKRKTVNGQPL